MKQKWALVAVLLSAHGARADDDPARRAFDEGVALEKRGDYVHALDKFMESARIKSTLGNRFHLAFCLEMTGKLASAWNEYEALDRAAREENKPDVVSATRQRTDALRPRVPEISLRAVPALPAGGEVLVDGTVVVANGVESKPVKVDPGEHVITAHAPDHASYRRAITIEPGARESVDVPFDAPVVAPTPPAPAPRTWTVPIALAGGAAVAAAGGVAAFLAASDAADSARATCPTRISCEDDQAKVRTLDTVALGAFVSAAALAALSIVFFRSTPKTHGFSTRGAIF